MSMLTKRKIGFFFFFFLLPISIQPSLLCSNSLTAKNTENSVSSLFFFVVVRSYDWKVACSGVKRVLREVCCACVKIFNIVQDFIAIILFESNGTVGERFWAVASYKKRYGKFCKVR